MRWLRGARRKIRRCEVKVEEEVMMAGEVCRVVVVDAQCCAQVKCRAAAGPGNVSTYQVPR